MTLSPDSLLVHRGSAGKLDYGAVSEPPWVGSPYRGYTYSYPHKTAYRPLAPPRPLGDLWRDEDRQALFLYLHVPFCEMRCGFCNLFSQPRPRSGLPERYLAALERQAEVVRDALVPASFARVALGGGTPTQLELPLLERLLDVAERLGASTQALPTSIETSPETLDDATLALLVERSIDRVSIGIQSFVDEEVRAVGRLPSCGSALRALERIKQAQVPTLNIDLIYGLPGQTAASWSHSLTTALRFAPEELYIYPLYVRPVTTLGRRDRCWDDTRLELYRRAREQLGGAGYDQVSMRMFRRTDAPLCDGPAYCCQQDGMVGLGCGARSYTRSYHYSQEWAVGARAVDDIIAAYVASDASLFASARYGYQLDATDRQRRFAIQTLLQASGLDLTAYQRHFGGGAFEQLPQLDQLERHGLLERSAAKAWLTAAGLERSDTVGPWLYSDRARARSASYEVR